MIKRIEITNFMSHEHTVIEPAAGLTVLVGPNNCGKSAIVAALQILCHNENSTYVLRHGERECSVKVETDDGHVVEWRRKIAPSYIIDGQTFDRLRGSGLPEELHKVLRLPRVDAGSDADFDVHFGAQKSPIFLLGGSAANAARFFASSSDAIQLVAMQKRHKDKLSDAQREKNRLEAESKQLNAELEVLEPVVALDHRVAAATRAYDEVIQRDAWLGAAEEDEVALRAKSGTVARCSAQTKALHALSAPPKLAPTEPLCMLIAKIANARCQRESTVARVNALAKLPPPPEIVPTEPLETLIVAMVVAESKLKAMALRSDALAALASPPEIAPVEPLDKLITAVGAEENRRQAAASRVGALQTLGPPPELVDISALAQIAAGIARTIAQTELRERQRQSLLRLAAPPYMLDVDTLGELIQRLVTSAREFVVRRFRSDALGTILDPPRLADESDLASLLALFAKTSSLTRRWAQASSVLRCMTPVPVPIETGAMSEFLRQLATTSANVRACELALAAADSRVAEAETELRSKAAGSLCPVCGNPLDPDRVVAHAVTGSGGHEHG